MGKTYKDKANHFAHHLSHGEQDQYYAKRNKLKYHESDIPEDVKEMVKILDYHGAGNRHGNHRKMYSKMKVDENHSQKMQDKQKFRKELNEK